MRSSGVTVGFLALLLACVLDTSTAQLFLTLMDPLDRNSYPARCENLMGDLVSGATLMLNATTPPSDCFSMTVQSSGEVILNFTISCEGFLQCKNGDVCSSSRKLEAYPAPADPPNESRRTVFALAEQNEPVVLESNVQGSNTGQVEVMWQFTGTGGMVRTLPPNGDRHSLVLNNPTAADAGEYYPIARTTNPSLSDSRWRTEGGQHYLVMVDIFYPPHFTSNLTCREESKQMWSCATQATGTSLNYDWFIDNELLNDDDERVSSMSPQSMIVLRNLQSSNMQLKVQVHNTNRDQTFTISQSAAILIPSTSSPNNGMCLLLWAPIVVGTMAVVIILLFIGFFLSLCLCHRRNSKLLKSQPKLESPQVESLPSQQQLLQSQLQSLQSQFQASQSQIQLLQLQLQSSQSTLRSRFESQLQMLQLQLQQLKADDSTVCGIIYKDFSGDSFSLSQGNLENYDSVLRWLSFVIGRLSNSNAQKNEKLLKVLEDLQKECDKQRVEFDDDESSDIEKPLCSELNTILKQILAACTE